MADMRCGYNVGLGMSGMYNCSLQNGSNVMWSKPTLVSACLDCLWSKCWFQHVWNVAGG
jgi:hypothetical protein